MLRQANQLLWFAVSEVFGFHRIGQYIVKLWLSFRFVGGVRKHKLPVPIDTPAPTNILLRAVQVDSVVGEAGALQGRSIRPCVGVEQIDTGMAALAAAVRAAMARRS